MSEPDYLPPCGATSPVHGLILNLGPGLPVAEAPLR